MEGNGHGHGHGRRVALWRIALWRAVALGRLGAAAARRHNVLSGDRTLLWLCLGLLPDLGKDKETNKCGSASACSGNDEGG